VYAGGRRAEGGLTSTAKERRNETNARASQEAPVIPAGEPGGGIEKAISREKPETAWILQKISLRKKRQTNQKNESSNEAKSMWGRGDDTLPKP